VSNTVTAVVGHRLGKVEAVRRLKKGFARIQGNLGLIAVEQETWEGDTLRFRIFSSYFLPSCLFVVRLSSAPHCMRRPYRRFNVEVS